MWVHLLLPWHVASELQFLPLIYDQKALIEKHFFLSRQITREMQTVLLWNKCYGCPQFTLLQYSPVTQDIILDGSEEILLPLLPCRLLSGSQLLLPKGQRTNGILISESFLSVTTFWWWKRKKQKKFKAYFQFLLGYECQKTFTCLNSYEPTQNIDFLWEKKISLTLTSKSKGSKAKKIIMAPIPGEDPFQECSYSLGPWGFVTA